MCMYMAGTVTFLPFRLAVVRYSVDNLFFSNLLMHVLVTGDVPAAAWTFFFSFSLLSVQFGTNWRARGRCYGYITGFASWRR